MIRKNENIATVLLIINLIIAIVGVFVLQNTLSTTESSLDITSIKSGITENLFFLIFIVALQFILSACLYNSIKKRLEKHSQIISTQNQIDENNDFDIQPTILEQQQKEETSILNDFKFVKDKIKAESIGILSIEKYAEKVFSVIAEKFEIAQGIFYISDYNDDKEQILKFAGGYAYFEKEDIILKMGEGLAGQVAKAQKTINIKHIPEGYIKIISGLGEATATNLIICPIIEEKETIAVLEIASFKEFSKSQEVNFGLLSEIIKDKILEIKRIS